MADEIKVDRIALLVAVDKYNQALSAFRPFTNTFTTETIAKVEPMDSQFTNELAGALDNMANDISVTMLAELEAFSQDVKMMIDTFTSTDEQLGEAIGGTE